MTTPHDGEYLFLGATEGEWPLQVWAQDAHARHWLAEMHDGKRHMYRVRISQVTEVRLVAPEFGEMTVDLPPRPNFVLNQPEGATPPDTQAQPTTQAAPVPVSADEDVLRFMLPDAPPRKRPRNGPVVVTYLPGTRCPDCGYRMAKPVPGCHGDQIATS